MRDRTRKERTQKEGNQLSLFTNLGVSQNDHVELNLAIIVIIIILYRKYY